VILITEGDRVLLQLRDDIAGIEYPGHWSLIAGWIENAESPSDAIRREITEELEPTGGWALEVERLTYLTCDDRQDRPWREYVFCAALSTPKEHLRIAEGRALEAFTVDQCLGLHRLAPHHRMYIERYTQDLGLDYIGSRGTTGEYQNMQDDLTNISEYFRVTQLGLEKDYPALEIGDGYVVPTTTHPTAALHPKADARFIALLEFAQDVPRGDHYHLRKVEYMTVLRGILRCEFTLHNNPEESTEILLEAGQTVRILPGCIHTYTAVDADVVALEYSAQRYEAADVIVFG
jgi:8-oxo-dGTP pyrophosphatase MutT (NUDIX family)